MTYSLNNDIDFILRIRFDALLMYSDSGERIDLLTVLKRAKANNAYRYRWQIELYFKRLRSLLEMREIPKKRAECMEAWLNGKMVLAILVEVLLSKQDFSPLE